jgi:hypothetical protein
MKKNVALYFVFDFAVGMSIAFSVYLFDFYTDISRTLSGVVGFFICFFAFLVLSALLVRLFSKKLFVSVSLSYFDSFFLILWVAFSALHILYNSAFQFVDKNGADYQQIHTFVIIGLIVVFAVAFIRGLFALCFYVKRSRQKGNEIMDVDGFLNKPVPLDKAKKAIFMDQPAGKDLFDRSDTEDSILSIINSYSGPTPIIIGIKGVWGVGKTTMANSVCRRVDQKHYLVIDTVNAWGYKDEKSLTGAILGKIVEKIDFGISSSSAKRAINQFLSSVFSDVKPPFLKAIPSLLLEEDDDNLSIINAINSYLKKNSLILIVRIEDFDRMKKDQILFVYQCVSSFLNLENVIYLLSFSEKPVMKALEDEGIEPQFLDKIINFSFVLFMPSEDGLSALYKKWLMNYLSFSPRNKHPNELDIIAKEWTIVLPSMREFVLMLNQIRRFAFNDNTIDLYDDILLQTLLIVDSDAYHFVRMNPDIFCEAINAGEFPDTESRYFGADGPQDRKKDFETFMKGRKSTNLRGIFYLLCPFLQGPGETSYSDIEKAKGRPITGARFMNKRYFDLFFLENENDYSSIKKEILPIFASDYDKNGLTQLFGGLYTRYREKFLSVLRGEVNDNKCGPIFCEIFRWCLTFSGDFLVPRTWNSRKTKVKVENIALDCQAHCDDFNLLGQMISIAGACYLTHPDVLFYLCHLSPTGNQSRSKEIRLAKKELRKEALSLPLFQLLDKGDYERGAIWHAYEVLPTAKGFRKTTEEK